MGENGLLQKMKKPLATALVGGMLITPNVLSQAQKATPGADLDNKTNTQIIINYVNTPNRFLFNNQYWNFHYFNQRMNRLYFRRLHQGTWIHFSMHINNLPGYGIHFNYQSNTPFYHNQYNGQIYNNNTQFFQQNIQQRKVSPRIRNNTGRR